MKKRTGLGAAALILIFFFVLAALAKGTRLIDFRFFQIQSSLYYVSLFFFVLGAFVMFLLASLSSPRRRPVERPAAAPSSASARYSPHVCEAQLAMELGDLEMADDALRRVQASDPDYWFAQKLRADLELQKGHWVKAELIYQHALGQATHPNARAWLRLSLARMYENQQLPDRARALYLDILDSLPLAPEPVFRLRFDAMQNRDWQQALQWQEFLEDHVPDSISGTEEQTIRVGIRYQVAEEEYERGGLKAAQALLKHIFRLTPAFVPAYLLSGAIQDRQEDGAGAIRSWERGFAATRNPALLERIADYYLLRNLPERAIEAYRRNLQSASEFPHLEYWLGELFLRLEMTDEAIRLFERLTRVIPDWPLPKRRLADALIKSGRHREAAAIYQQVVGSLSDSALLPWKCETCGTEYEDYRGFCSECLEWNSINTNQPQAGPMDTTDEASPAIRY